MRRTHLLKVLVAIFLVAGLLVPSIATALSSTTVKLWIGNPSMSVNGMKQQIDTQGTKPVIVAGRTLVPIRAVIEAFDGSVAWDATASKVTVTLGKDSLELWIDKPQASLNGIALSIDSANSAVVPVITNGRTMLPLRFVAESLGIDVQYDAVQQMITLVYSIKEIVVPPVTYVLTVITVGNGTATPATGTTYAYGTVVTLTATPAAGYTFSGWSGDLSFPPTNPPTITMDATKTVTATFAITPPVVAGDTDAPLAPTGCVLSTGTENPAGTAAQQSALMAWVQLAWTPVTHNDLTGYNVDIFEDPAKNKTFETVIESDFVGVPEQEFIASGHNNCLWDNLTLGTRYWVRIQSVDAQSNRSDWLLVGCIDTGIDDKLPTVTSITTELFRPNIVWVSWSYAPGTANMENVLSYQLERKEAPYLDGNGNPITLVWGSYVRIAETPGGSYIDTGLDRTKKYLYRVRAVSRYGITYSAWLEMLEENAVQPRGI